MNELQPMQNCPDGHLSAVGQAERGLREILPCGSTPSAVHAKEIPTKRCASLTLSWRPIGRGGTSRRIHDQSEQKHGRDFLLVRKRVRPRRSRELRDSV